MSPGFGAMEASREVEARLLLDDSFHRFRSLNDKLLMTF
jgi:hypothetical protein